ncbi:hypothetical protein NPIL_251521 [Nephila pilipes]|uniref:Uncharacterized protein n=1 Tax=Nephila pilipes TaxID=299642 RepID=A0A8X6MR91_NEPPI|nr:hypothetical protein NPIL_251521 [Nephila pilipes]
MLTSMSYKKRHTFALQYKYWMVTGVFAGSDRKTNNHETSLALNKMERQWDSLSYVFGYFFPVESAFHSCAFLSIVTEQIHPYLVTVYSKKDAVRLKDKATCHVAKIILVSPLTFKLLKP